MGIMVSSCGRLVWGGAHRASKAPGTVLSLKVRDESKGAGFTSRALPLS